MPPITTGSAIRRHAPPVKVYLRAAWGDPWVEHPHLEPLSIEFCCSPAMPEAILRWRYGRGMRQGEITRSVVARLDIVGQFVKIWIDPSGTFATNTIPPWYGRIIEEQDERHGALFVNGARVANGVQTFVAWGMEAELDVDLIAASRVQASSDPPREAEVLRALPFNAGAGTPKELSDEALLPNRSTEIGEKGCYVFAADLKADAEPNYWNAQEIAEYFFALYTPRDVWGAERIPWRLDDVNGQVSHLESHLPKYDPRGKTIRQALDDIIDRRRAAGWYVRVDETTTPHTCYLVSFTLNDAEITLPTLQRIPANPNQVSLDFDRALDIISAEVRQSGAVRYDQVIARGARMGAVFTVSAAGSNIEAGWTTANQTAYNNAASGDAGYAGWDDYLKILRNKQARAKHALEDVYSSFVLPATWDGDADNGIGTSEHAVFGVYDPDTQQIDYSKTVEFWPPGLRFQRETPLRAGVDYSGTRIADGLCTELVEDPLADRLATIVAIKIESDGSGVTRYQLVDRLDDREANVLDNATARTWSCSVRVREDRPGITLKVQGHEQHALASADWAPLATVEVEGGELNWRDNLLATVYVLADAHIEIRYPDDIDLGLGELFGGLEPRRLVIDVPDAHYDYVVPDTVVAVANGSLVRSTSGGTIRDDTGRLTYIARTAAEWYCNTRQTLTLQYRQLRRTVDLGDLITSIGDGATVEEIRTCVTRIRYDIAAGTTTLQTQHAELDARVL